MHRLRCAIVHTPRLHGACALVARPAAFARSKSDGGPDEPVMSSARAAAEALRREREAEEFMAAERKAAREAEREAHRKARESMTPEELEQRKAEIAKKRKEELRTTRRVLGGQQTSGLEAMKAVVGKGTVLLPIAVVFAFISVAYVIYESTQRHKNPVCIDCNRQKEIAEEIYFGKRTQHVVKQMN